MRGGREGGSGRVGGRAGGQEPLARGERMGGPPVQWPPLRPKGFPRASVMSPCLPSHAHALHVARTPRGDARALAKGVGGGAATRSGPLTLIRPLAPSLRTVTQCWAGSWSPPPPGRAGWRAAASAPLPRAPAPASAAVRAAHGQPGRPRSAFARRRSRGARPARVCAPSLREGDGNAGGRDWAAHRVSSGQDGPKIRYRLTVQPWGARGWPV